LRAAKFKLQQLEKAQKEVSKEEAETARLKSIAQFKADVYQHTKEAAEFPDLDAGLVRTSKPLTRASNNPTGSLSAVSPKACSSMAEQWPFKLLVERSSRSTLMTRLASRRVFFVAWKQPMAVISRMVRQFYELRTIVERPVST
jgi:hypothetical protein